MVPCVPRHNCSTDQRQPFDVTQQPHPQSENYHTVSSLQRLCYEQKCNLYKILLERDPAGLFISPENQKLLKSLTRLRLDKVYRKRVVLNNKVEYKFMTTEEIEAEIKSAFKKAEAMLQMPPVVKVCF